MQIKSIDSQYNSPNFGIKYIKPRSWDPDVLDTLMKSNLVKQIDSKYPSASVEFEFFSGKIIPYNYILKFYLNNIIEAKIHETSYKKLIDEIRTTRLKDIEKNFIDNMKRKKTYEQRVENIYRAAEESNKRLIKETPEKKTQKNIFVRFVNLFK